MKNQERQNDPRGSRTEELILTPAEVRKQFPNAMFGSKVRSEVEKAEEFGANLKVAVGYYVWGKTLLCLKAVRSYPICDRCNQEFIIENAAIIPHGVVEGQIEDEMVSPCCLADFHYQAVAVRS